MSGITIRPGVCDRHQPNAPTLIAQTLIAQTLIAQTPLAPVGTVHIGPTSP
jgi:hypothetical protein